MRQKNPPATKRIPTHGRLPGSKNIEYGPAVVKMRRNPGKWYHIHTFPTPASASSTGNHIRHGRYKHFQDGQWEATSRGADLYVRYLGE